MKKKKSFIENISGARLYINLEFINRYIVIDGYFLEDPLNMARIGGYYGDKMKLLKEGIKQLDINDSFKFAFIHNYL